MKKDGKGTDAIGGPDGFARDGRRVDVDFPFIVERVDETYIVYLTAHCRQGVNVVG
jgi:hypothetical protein